MKLLCLDFESYFDQKYSLKSPEWSTESYVRTDKLHADGKSLFKAHMVGYWAPHLMPAPVEFAPHLLAEHDEVRRQIETSAVLCHHAHFDGLILEHHYGLRPLFWLDTLSMARLVLPRLKSHSLDALATHFGLPAKSVPYNLFRGLRDLPRDVYVQLADGCKHDVFLTVEIFKRLLPHVPKDELKVIDATVRMFTEPCLRLDHPRMETFLKAERVRKAKAMLAAGQAIWGFSPLPENLREYLAGVETELQSADKFRVALEALGYPCPMKPSPKVEGQMIPAIAKNDEPMKELLAHPDERVQALAAARLQVKSTINETRAASLLSTSERGAMTVNLKPYAAKTLRFGGADDNYQNLPRGGEIRKSLLAPEGHLIVVADAGQVECRGLNKMAREQWVIDAFAAGRDIYCEMATKAYGRVVTPDDKMGRFGGKTLELGCGYGLGWMKYQRQMRQGMLGGPPVTLTDERAQNDVNAYRATHPRVKEMWSVFGKQILPMLASGGEMTFDCLRIKDHRIWLPNGTALNYEGLYWGFYGEQPQSDEEPQWWHPGRKGKAKYYGGKLVENVIQALWSGLFIRQAMNVIGARYKIVLQVHDEIVAVARKEEAADALAWMKEVLSTPPSWCPGIPLAADGLFDERYAK